MDECMEYFNERMSAKLELNQEHANQYLRISKCESGVAFSSVKRFPIGPISPEGRGYTVVCPRVMPNNAHDKFHKAVVISPSPSALK